MASSKVAPERSLAHPRYGAQLVGENEVEFRVWAPRAESLSVRLGGDDQRVTPMQQETHGEYSLRLQNVGADTDYQFVFPDGRVRPDPASRFQPYGVHGASRVVAASAFEWTDGAWRGLELDDYIVYELHVGTFTPAGTFDSMIEKLPYLRDLGITAIEIMPIAQFPGNRNWGYDGVYLYAPQNTYGGCEGLKRLVDQSHAHGLAVVLDVVYNHLGPEGNYLNDYGPYFTERYRTPWGPALNFDGPESDPVRRYFIDNAVHWMEEYHIDALRLDAIHGIYDFSAKHVLAQMSDEFHQRAYELGRHAYLIAESDLNDVRVILPTEKFGDGMDAQWHDDFHHSLQANVYQRTGGYFADYQGLACLKKSMKEGFVYDGQFSPFRGRVHGNSSTERPGRQFVICTQNHDQIANASHGLRLSELGDLQQQKMSAAIMLCAPMTPMLFMGQEYGETAPFHYFISHTDAELVKAVQQGRYEEFAEFFRDREFPTPDAESTFEHARLNWESLGQQPHAEVLDFYRQLLKLRRTVPALKNNLKELTDIDYSEEHRWFTIQRRDPMGDRVLLYCNLAEEERAFDVGLEWKLALKSWNDELPEGRIAGHGAALFIAPRI